jgi:hypothetical protein
MKNIKIAHTQICRERQDSNETESNHKTNKIHMPPCRSFSVLAHHFHMNFRFLFGTIPELLPDLLSVVEVSVYNQRGNRRK